MRLYCFLLLSVLALAGPASAAPFSQASDSTRKKLSLVPLPAIFYTPETRLGLGVALFATFKLGNDTITRTSNVQFVEAYTFNKQFLSENTFNVFTPGEKYFYSGELSFYDYPILYYGVGNKTAKENEELIAYNLFFANLRGLRKLGPSLFGGLLYRGTYLYDLELDKDSSLLYERPAKELKGGWNSGLGLAVLHDNRNNIANTSRGHYAEATALSFSRIFGTDYSYERYTFDLRQFAPLSRTTVLALQGTGTFNFGAPSFRELALLGGQNIMRGYFRGRYRDKQLLAAQTELRWHMGGHFANTSGLAGQVLSRLGFVVFGAAGDVSDTPGNFALSDFKYSYGAGLRIMMNKKDRVNIRIDYGKGKNTSGLYFGIAEAF